MVDTVGPLNKRLKKALVENKWTDIAFFVGEMPKVQVITAHRCVISAASPVFEAMCFGELAEGSKTVPVPDITPEAFKAVLEYVYTDDVQLTSVQAACDILYAAEKYIITSLTSKCVQYLMSNVNKYNVWHVLENCCGREDMLRRCAQELCHVLQMPEFLIASRETLLLILDQDKLPTTEDALINACVRWAEAQCKKSGLQPIQKNLREVLGPALGKIRFLSMTADEVVRIVGVKKLLTCEETLAIVGNIIRSGTYVIPSNISKERKPRSRQ